MGKDLEDKLGYRFKRSELLKEALTHKSYAMERRLEPYNERLEFLGDSVLALVVAAELFRLHAGSNEGRLSKLKSLIVSRPSLALWADELKLGEHLFLGAGEETSGGRTRPSILANAIEAVLGAMYLDGGLEPPAKLIRGWLERTGLGLEEADHKSRLQEIMQRRHKSPPQYDLTRSSGPDHDKTFHVVVRMGKNTLGEGEGKSKKEAEQSAAEDALSKLKE
jgi:ribonuclease III